MNKKDFLAMRRWLNRVIPNWKKCKAKDLKLLYEVWKDYRDLLP